MGDTMKPMLTIHKTIFVITACIALSAYTLFAKEHRKDREVHFVRFAGNSMIIADKCGKETTAIDSVTLLPIVFWFVNNTFPDGGTGTIEFPFNNLLAAQNISSGYDIIYVFPGNGSDAPGLNAGITLFQGQQLLGATIEQTVETTAGCVKIPAQVAGIPVISNTNNTSNPLAGRIQVLDLCGVLVLVMHLLNRI